MQNTSVCYSINIRFIVDIEFYGRPTSVVYTGRYHSALCNTPKTNLFINH